MKRETMVEIPLRRAQEMRDEIASLRQRVADLTRALEYVWDRCGPHVEFPPCLDAVNLARAALASSDSK